MPFFVPHSPHGFARITNVIAKTAQAAAKYFVLQHERRRLECEQGSRGAQSDRTESHDGGDAFEWEDGV